MELRDAAPPSYQPADRVRNRLTHKMAAVSEPEPRRTGDSRPLPTGGFLLAILEGFVAAALLTACSSGLQEGEISGFFLRPDSDNHEGIRIFLPGTPYQAFTDRRGWFHINNIAAGDYEIVVREDACQEFRREISIAAGRSINLATRSLEPVSPPVGAVSGKALLEGKENHAGTFVLLLGTAHNTVTDVSGTFRFEDVRPGSYRLAAFHDGYKSLTDVRLELDGPTELVMPDLILTPFNIESATPAQDRAGGNRVLWGTVFLEGELRHGGTTVSVVGEPDLKATTLPDGTFKLADLGEGPYEVEIAHEGFETERLAGLVPFSATEGIGIQVILRRHPPPVGRGVLQGTVTLEGETNHEGTTVRLIGAQQSVITDSSGRFIFVDIPSGQYVLEASHTGYKTSRLLGVEVQAEAISQAPPLELRAVTAEDLAEGVEGYGGLEGVVTLEDDPDAGGVTVAVQTANLVTLSMPGGSFSFSTVPAGQHLLIFEKAGYQTAYLPDISIFPDQTTYLEPIVLARQLEHPYVVSTDPPDRSRRVGFDEFLDVLVKFSDRMDGASVKRNVFITPPVETRRFFGRESEMSDIDTLHLQLLRTGQAPLQFGTTYRIVIGQEATNIRGVPLEEDYAFRFTTDGPLIVRTVPPDGSRNVSLLPGERMVIETNVPVDAASLAAALRIHPRAESIPEVFSSRRGAGGRVEIQVGLNFGQRYSVSIGRQLRTIDGQLFSNTPYRFTFTMAEIRDTLPEPNTGIGRRRFRSR